MYKLIATLMLLLLAATCDPVPPETLPVPPTTEAAQ